MRAARYILETAPRLKSVSIPEFLEHQPKERRLDAEDILSYVRKAWYTRVLGCRYHAHPGQVPKLGLGEPCDGGSTGPFCDQISSNNSFSNKKQCDLGLNGTRKTILREEMMPTY